MTQTPIFTEEAARGRRRFIGYGLSAGLVLLAVAACGNLKATPRDPDRKPHWEREEQRDD